MIWRVRTKHGWVYECADEPMPGLHWNEWGQTWFRRVGLAGHVYVAKGSDGVVKIGRSMVVERRAYALNYSHAINGRKFVMVYYTPMLDDSDHVEGAALRLMCLEATHIGGEMFSDTTIATAVRCIATALRQVRGDELPLGGTYRHNEAYKRAAMEQAP